MKYYLALAILAILLGGFDMSAQNLTGDPARDIPIVYDPLPEEHADENRVFQGIPSIAVADSKNIWATWYTGGITEDKDNIVVLARSRDGGLTWTKPLFCIGLPNDIRMFDPSMWLAPDGKLHLYWSASHQVWTMTATNPAGDAPVWSAPKYVCPGVVMNKPIVDSQGRWLIPASVWNVDHGNKYDRSPAGPTGAWCVVSEDSGKTYRQFGRAYMPPEHALFDEHSIVELKDRRLWLVNRTKTGIGQFFSSDKGKTWTDFQVAPFKHTSSRFFLRRLASGNILFIKHGDILEDCGRSKLKAFISKDEGKTWEGGLVLDERPGVSYPDGDQAPDGTIHIIYDFDRHGQKFIHNAIITEDDVLAGKLVTPTSKLRLVVNHATGIHPARKMGPNANGAPIEADQPRAVMEGLDGTSSDILKPAVLLFTDRQYKLREVPKWLEGRNFIRSSIDGTKAICRQDGNAYVMTPLSHRNRDNVLVWLAENGFVKVAQPEFVLFGEPYWGGLANTVSVFRRKMTAGETLDFGKWGILVY